MKKFLFYLFSLFVPLFAHATEENDWGTGDWYAKYYTSGIQGDNTPPAENWYATDFDDSSWPTMHGPLFDNGVNTFFPESTTFFTRRTININNIGEYASFKVRYNIDNHAKFYINGVLVRDIEYVGENFFEIDKAYFKKGKNLFAVSIEDYYGGRCLDYGIFLEYTVAGNTYQRYGNELTLVSSTNKTLTTIDLSSSIIIDGQVCNITEIADEVFKGFSKLETIKLPTTLKKIGKGAFQNCIKLTSVSGLENIESIGEFVFAGCKNLPSIYAPKCLSVGKQTFYNCVKLAKVNMVNLEKADEKAFQNCKNLQVLNVPVLYDVKENTFDMGTTGSGTIGNYTYEILDVFAGDCVMQGAKITSYLGEEGQYIYFPNTVTYDGTEYPVLAIGERLFEDKKVNGVKFPEGLISIEGAAFHNTQGFGVINLPASLVFIRGDEVFEGTEFSKLNLPSDSKLRYIGPHAFYYHYQKDEISLPKCIVCIGGGAFWQTSIRVNIPLDSNLRIIESAGLWAHGNPYEEFKVPENVRFLGEDFVCCGGTLDYTTNSKIEKLPGRCFGSWDGMYTKKVIIPSTITEISDNAFECSRNLEEVYNYASIPQAITENTFSEYGTLHVKKGCADIYEDTEYWNYFVIVEDLDEEDAIHEECTIEDSQTNFANYKNTGYKKIIYNRTFNNTNWQAFYVPFPMNYSDWSDKFEIARINDVHQWDNNDDGIADKTEMEFFKVKSGSIAPNTPYLIRAKNTGRKSIVLSNSTLYTSTEKRYNVSSWDTDYNIIGTYKTINGAEMVAQGYYALGGGSLKQAASGSSNLNAFRWYMSVADRNGNTKNINEVKVCVFDFDEEETGITIQSAEKENDKVFDLSGRRVNKAAKGIYIKNGKKIVIH